MKHCTNCGGEIADEAKFCTWCGSAVTSAAAPAPTPTPATAATVAGAVPTVTVSVTSSDAPTPRPYSTAAPVSSGTYPSSNAGYSQQPYGQQQYGQPTYPSGATYSSANATGARGMDGLAIATLVFLGLSVLMNLISALGSFGAAASDSSLAGMGFMYLVTAAIPAVIAVLLWKKIQAGEVISTGFKVVTLIFGSLIGGILLFVRKEQ